MRKRTYIWALAVVVLLAACGTSTLGGSIEGSWQLESGTFDGEQITVVDSHPITIIFKDEALSGTAACNGYGGAYEHDEDNLRITEFFITEMACSPASVMQSEVEYTTALFNVDTVSVDGDRLELSGTRSDLTFTRLAAVPTSDLQGTVWVLDGLVEGEAVSTVSGERATLELFSDGSLIASTGCRTLTGSYIINDSEVQITDLSASGECTAELAAQDNHVISALEGGFRVEIDGDRMTTWVAGNEGLIYRAEG